MTEHTSHCQGPSQPDLTNRDRVIINALLCNPSILVPYLVVVTILFILNVSASCTLCRYQTGSTYIIISQILLFELCRTNAEVAKRQNRNVMMLKRT